MKHANQASTTRMMTKHHTTAPTLSRAIAAAWDARWSRQKDGVKTHKRALHVASVLGPNLDVRSVSSLMVEGLVEDLRDTGLSDSSINGRLAALSTALKRANVEWGLTHSVTIPGLRSGERTYTFAEEDMDRFEGELATLMTRSPDYDVEAASLFRFLRFTGCRLGEAMNLPKSGVNVSSQTITFKDTKNGDDRTIPIHPSLLETITTLMVEDGALLFSLSPSAFVRRFNDARDNLGLPSEANRHALRRTFVTSLVAQGAPPPMIARYVGHKSLQTLMRYTKPKPEDLRSLFA